MGVSTALIGTGQLLPILKGQAGSPCGSKDCYQQGCRAALRLPVFPADVAIDGPCIPAKQQSHLQSHCCLVMGCWCSCNPPE